MTKKFLNLVRQQLNSFASDSAIEQLVVYVAKSQDGESPSFEVAGQWPDSGKNFLQPLETDKQLRIPSPKRRWYPLQEGSILLGVLRVERVLSKEEWPENLDKRLQATSMALAQCLSLELEQKRLRNELIQQREQIGIMVHQLRNPLAALRTYAKLLLRKLEPESNYRSLVEGLLNEQEQLNKYVSVLDDLSQAQLPVSQNVASGLLLPPVLLNEKSTNLRDLLEPLIERASVTANLQGRDWRGPSQWPLWMTKSISIEQGIVAEIVANLLENAFKYSSKSAPIGIHLNDKGICVWDGGDPIIDVDRNKIFEKGFRGQTSSNIQGSGIGLSLARQLANKLKAELILLKSPSDFDDLLPLIGNAFSLCFTKELTTEK